MKPITSENLSVLEKAPSVVSTNEFIETAIRSTLGLITLRLARGSDDVFRLSVVVRF
jgi:hypothetical protein